MLSESQKRIIAAYLVLHLVLWSKILVFFLVYGHGKVVREIRHIVPPEVSFMDSAFHFTVHVIIAILALAFGRELVRFDLMDVLKIVAIAVPLHDVGYWLTRSHPSLLYSIMDFGIDSALLVSFIFAGFLLAKHPAFRAVKVPFLETGAG